MYKIVLGGPNEYAVFGLNKPEAGPNLSVLWSLETSLEVTVELCFVLLTVFSYLLFNIVEGYKDVPSS